MIQSTLGVQNAILFVLDPTNSSAHVPPYVIGQTTASTTSCVSFATLPDVDGEVTITLFSKHEQQRDSAVGLEVFDGHVETPGRKLAIVDSQFVRVLECDVPSKDTRIRVVVDDPKMPTAIWLSIL